MPFVVEDGSGKADANSLTSVEYAVAYHGAHVGSDRAVHSKFLDCEQGTQEALLIQATEMVVQAFSFKGVPRRYGETPGQALPFPRLYCVNARTGMMVDYTSVPLDVQNLVADVAGMLADGGDVSATINDRGDVVAETVGPTSFTYARGATQLEEQRSVFTTRQLQTIRPLVATPRVVRA